MKNRKFALNIFHDHLLPGGVTDVIKHSLPVFAGMKNIKSIQILCGRSQNTTSMREAIEKLHTEANQCPITLEVISELDYRSHQKERPAPESLRKLLLERFSSPHSIWLIHNYHLGKNWALTAALNRIAREGHQKMIYQIHDFPECARYANLNELKTNIPGSLYPRSSSLRYCVINGRDFNIMKEAGLPDGIIHLLENPVPLQENPSKVPIVKSELMKKLKAYTPLKGNFHPQGELWLYPVRSIRRKNVLEGGFLCSLIKDDVNLIVTLPGISSQENEYSQLCEKAFTQGLIPGFWGTGSLPGEAGISYQEMISASDLIFSSSVQEGFGYMYLNALVWQKPLLARHLDIMDGFTPLMTDYPAHLYETILVPSDQDLKTRLHRDYSQRLDDLEDFQSPEVKKKLLEDLNGLIEGDSVDFSYLSPSDQYSFLERCQSRLFISECRELNNSLLEEIQKLKSLTVSDKETQIFYSYGEEAYRKAFKEILDSFEEPLTADQTDELLEEKVDKNLQLEFSRLEFLRLLYR
jgi:hypothetical protein